MPPKPARNDCVKIIENGQGQGRRGMKKVLITGISGFVGGFLADHLLQQGGVEISGTYLSSPSINASDEVKKHITFIQADLTDPKQVNDAVGDIKPDIVYHLAAISSPHESFKNPAQTIGNNISAQVHLLEAVRKHELTDAKILIVSSSEVYGIISPEDIPVNENAPLRPASPYGVSKIAQDFLGLQYFNTYHLPIFRVRPFNHIGPGQSPNFVVSSFAKQIVEIEKRKRDPVFRVGNLEAKRDFTDVRDMVRAYSIILDKGEEGEVYNVGSGTSIKIDDILQKLISLSGASITIEVDSALLRPSDLPEVACDNTKIISLGWNPQIAIEKSLSDTLEYWRKIL